MGSEYSPESLGHFTYQLTFLPVPFSYKWRLATLLWVEITPKRLHQLHQSRSCFGLVFLDSWGPLSF